MQKNGEARERVEKLLKRTERMSERVKEKIGKQKRKPTTNIIQTKAENRLCICQSDCAICRFNQNIRFQQHHLVRPTLETFNTVHAYVLRKSPLFLNGIQDS